MQRLGFKKQLFHQTNVIDIDYFIMIEISGFPVGKFCLGVSMKPSLKQNDIISIEHAVQIDSIFDSSRIFCTEFDKAHTPVFADTGFTAICDIFLNIFLFIIIYQMHNKVHSQCEEKVEKMALDFNKSKLDIFRVLCYNTPDYKLSDGFPVDDEAFQQQTINDLN